MVARWREAKNIAKAIEKLWSRALPDADSAVALDVAVAAHWTKAGACLADLTAEQMQVDDLLNVGDGVHVLGESHPPARDRPLRFREDVRGAENILVRHAARR